MNLDEMRDQICDSMRSFEGYSLWDDTIQETTPGPYGFEVESVEVERNNIWVDVPNRTFTFQNLHLEFTARLGGSNDESGYNETFKFKLSGTGGFTFVEGSSQILVNHVTANESLDLYGESTARVD